MKALLLGLTTDPISAAQHEPFADERRLLRRQGDLTVQHVRAKNIIEMGEACLQHDSDVVFFFPSWRENADVVTRTFQALRQEFPNRQLIFVDPFAQASSNYFSVLPYVDRFLKRQRLQNVADYQKSFVGGCEFVEFIARQWGAELRGWFVGSAVPVAYEHRIASGWNLGTARRFRKALRQPRFFPKRPARNNTHKNIDVFCRLALGPKRQQEWYCQYRMAAVAALEPLGSDYQLAASARFVEEGLIPQSQYLRELKHSRVVFSPFGWGETCWRDFDAICNDCLLVKPSMAHLDTQPNIFIENETYVPVRWDFADLEEKCRYYLERPEEMARIVGNARRVYTDYLEKGGFVNAIAQSLSVPVNHAVPIVQNANLGIQNS